MEAKERALQICEDHQVLRHLSGMAVNPKIHRQMVTVLITYHREYDHTTQDCQGLDQEIERIKAEYLRLRLL